MDLRNFSGLYCTNCTSQIMKNDMSTRLENLSNVFISFQVLFATFFRQIKEQSFANIEGGGGGSDGLEV